MRRRESAAKTALIPKSLQNLREAGVSIIVASDRKEDIPGLCEVLSAQIARDLKIRPKRLSPEALQRIGDYDFPGNIRELPNLLERAHILGLGPEITAGELSLRTTPSRAPTEQIDRTIGF